jgi:hypothetical protein
MDVVGALVYVSSLMVRFLSYVLIVMDNPT